MEGKRQCSVCNADVSMSVGVGRPGGPRRLYFAGREHLFCAGHACVMAFKRAPESFATAGIAVTGASGGPPPQLTRDKAPSPFRVRVAARTEEH